MASQVSKNLLQKSRLWSVISTNSANSVKEKWPTKRYFSNSNSNSDKSGITDLKNIKVTNMPPMNEPVKNLPAAIYTNFKEEDQKTQITILSDGLTVASENRFGAFCTVGVVIDSGSRYEVAYPSGIAHFLEKLAFHSTKSYPDKDEMINKLEQHGGICDSQASRDTFIYAASAYTSGLNDVIEILSEATVRPRITEDEVNLARQAVRFELETLNMRPEQETILTDMIHAAAYNDNTLGLPKLCPADNVHKIDRKILLKYLSNHYTPKRIVVAGVGVDHSELVEHVQRHFVDTRPIWDDNNNNANKCDDSIAQYTGGFVQEECEIPQFASAGLPVLSHVVIGLESCSHRDTDFIAMCVLNIMMGGGGSFSAGGPGKGMYTRLYVNVLNRYHWMYSATACNHAYSDTGLFCIHASAPPNHLKDMVEVIVREMSSMPNNITDDELARAKTQLQSMLLMNLESRPVMFEDIGRQVLASGMRKRPKYFIDEIDKVSRDDVVRVAKRLLKSQPSVAARGDLRKMPTLEWIQSGLNGSGRVDGVRKLSLFR
ncbi:unnamed protein product [Phyllotreta striolata]|uniref:Mitochondrial-processing peptidase subunit alpha n=1 Tax=Phyllotreta striolata TaxID=444603 RepID=A0A9N9TUB3_PHYSR|nr:unnamed protein product [Phyllotreta striolata]